jgi:hypothetical protein
MGIQGIPEGDWIRAIWIFCFVCFALLTHFLPEKGTGKAR